MSCWCKSKATNGHAALRWKRYGNSRRHRTRESLCTGGEIVNGLPTFGRSNRPVRMLALAETIVRTASYSTRRGKTPMAFTSSGLTTLRGIPQKIAAIFKEYGQGRTKVAVAPALRVGASTDESWAAKQKMTEQITQL